MKNPYLKNLNKIEFVRKTQEILNDFSDMGIIRDYVP